MTPRVPSAADRLVAVLAGEQGSGVLLTPRLVLTSAHVLNRWVDGVAGPAPRALAVGGRLSTPVTCEVLWTGSDTCDAALLLTERPLVDAGRLGPLRWGACGTWEPVGGCQAMGFPRVQRSPDGELEAVQVPGTLTPLSGSLRGRYVLRTNHHPPTGGTADSPWAGEPALAGQVLIGIASEDPLGWEHSAVDAVPLRQIVRDRAFWHTLREHWPAAPSLIRAHGHPAGPGPYAAAVRGHLRPAPPPERSAAPYTVGALLGGAQHAPRRPGRPAAHPQARGHGAEPDDGRQLLQRIAIWLVRNGRVELSREQAVRQLELAMKGLRHVREQGTTEEVLTHLLNRSGLLQAPSTDSVQFIHRTFQDYLAAKEFQESDSLDELLKHVAESLMNMPQPSDLSVRDKHLTAGHNQPSGNRPPIDLTKKGRPRNR